MCFVFLLAIYILFRMFHQMLKFMEWGICKPTFYVSDLQLLPLNQEERKVEKALEIRAPGAKPEYCLNVVSLLRKPL